MDQNKNEMKKQMLGTKWFIIFITALWTIWKERNKAVFENQTQPSHISSSIILQQAKETQEAFLNPLNLLYSEPVLTQWSLPIADKLKLNTDGCSKGDPGQSGYGGLLRDEVGTWVWGYYGYLGNCTSLETELWGLYRGLTIIMQNIETDSLTAMELVKGGAERTCLYRALIEDFNFMLKRCNCTIQHTPREANQSADALASIVVNRRNTRSS